MKRLWADARPMRSAENGAGIGLFSSAPERLRDRAANGPRADFLFNAFDRLKLRIYRRRCAGSERVWVGDATEEIVAAGEKHGVGRPLRACSRSPAVAVRPGLEIGVFGAA